MRRPALALVLLAGALAATTQQVSTASNSIPDSTAVHRGTTVTGAAMTATDYSVSDGLITTVEPRLRGKSLLTKTVTARFGTGPEVLCAAGVLTVIDAVSDEGEATYTCPNLSEPAQRPAHLLITVS